MGCQWQQGYSQWHQLPHFRLCFTAFWWDLDIRVSLNGTIHLKRYVLGLFTDFGFARFFYHARLNYVDAAESPSNYGIGQQR